MSENTVDTSTLISEIIPAEEVEKLEVGRTEEIIQPLLDLGYIENAAEDLIPDGIRLFRKDYLAVNLLQEFTPNFLFLATSELEGEELDLLHTLTAMAGDFSLNAMPELGAVNLCSRIIHYRLALHRLYTLPVNSPFSKSSLDALKKTKEWINNLPAESTDLINLLGNIPQLIRHININENGRLHKLVVAFKYDEPDEIQPFSVPVPNALKAELAEDESEPDEDNEDQMLAKQILIESKIEELSQNEVFNKVEKIKLNKKNKASRRTENKQAQVTRLIAMRDHILKELNAVSKAAAVVGEPIRLQIIDLEKVHSTLSKQHLSLSKGVEQKEQLIQQFSKGKNKKDNKERTLKRLRGKRENNNRKKRIEQLIKEIEQLESNEKAVEKLEIEKSTINVELLLVTDELTRVQSKLGTLKSKFETILKNRTSFVAAKQTSLQTLLSQLDELKEEVNKIRFSFRGKMHKVLDDTFYKNVVKKEIFKNRNQQVLEDFSIHPYNNYLIRLIQLFQWTNGYYYGKLDAKVGDRTLSALDDMVNYTKRLRLKFILTRLSENNSGTPGFWLLNIKYLFENLSTIIGKKEDGVTTDDLIKKYEDNFMEGDAKNTSIGNKATDEAYSEMVTENKSDIRKKGIIRRIYYGVKGIASTLYHGLLDLIHLLKKGIKKLVYLVKNLIKIIYREIREGVRKFKDGIHFLFGKRVFTTPTTEGSAILTKFDFDFDVTSYSPRIIDRKARVQHAATLYRFSSNLDFTLVLTGKVLKWVFECLSLATPFGWARLAIKIAFHYKKLILSRLVALGKKVVKTIITIKYKISKDRVPA